MTIRDGGDLESVVEKIGLSVVLMPIALCVDARRVSFGLVNKHLLYFAHLMKWYKIDFSVFIYQSKRYFFFCNYDPASSPDAATCSVNSRTIITIATVVLPIKESSKFNIQPPLIFRRECALRERSVFFWIWEGSDLSTSFVSDDRYHTTWNKEKE